MTTVFTTGDNNFGVAKWIVDATAGKGTHTTIAAALTSASSGDTIFIRPGTYTENPTLKAGVNLSAFTCDAFNPNVIINGTCTFTAAGTVSISGIRLQTNSAALLAVTGSAASIVYLTECYLNCSNNTGITFSSSSSSANIWVYRCFGNLGTTGIGYFAHSSAGTLSLNYCQLNNTGGSSTTSTCSKGVLNFSWTTGLFPIAVSSTGVLGMHDCQFDTSATNTTCLTFTGSGVSYTKNSRFSSGTAVGYSVGSGVTLGSSYDFLQNSNTSVFSNSGTLNWQGNTPLTSFTPGVAFGGGTTGITYGTQAGYYQIIGGLVFYAINVNLTSKGSSTGNATITGLPFSVGSTGTSNFHTTCNFFVNFTFDSGYSSLVLEPTGGATTMAVLESGSNKSLGFVTDAAFSNTTNISFIGFYSLN